MDKTLEFIKNLNISKDEYLVVAVSSGPDSMFLLNLLNKLGYKCVCAHVNHNVRKESINEYEFLENYCGDNNIIFEGTEIKSYKNDKFSEEEAREFRYHFFASLINKYNSRFLFTAHHGDDLMETVLMRLVRGSSIYGYPGFLSITDKNNYQVIRPLIYLDKAFIEQYNKDNNISYFIDKTNEEDIHTRNRFRHHVLPPLKEEDAEVHLKFLKYSEKLNDLIMYIDRIMSSYKGKVFTDNSINIYEYNKLDDYEKKLIVEKLLDINYPDNLYLITDKHTKLIQDLISKEGNKEINLPGNIIVRKEYGQILFIKDVDIESYSYILNDSVDLELGIINKADKTVDNSNFEIKLNSKDIKLPIIVRSRRDGDKMQIKNMNGSKKINDIFIDSKISKEKRDKWPIVCDSNGTILWIPGLKKSNLDIPFKNDYDIILRYQFKEEK